MAHKSQELAFAWPAGPVPRWPSCSAFPQLSTAPEFLSEHIAMAPVISQRLPGSAISVHLTQQVGSNGLQVPCPEAVASCRSAILSQAASLRLPAVLT